MRFGRAAVTSALLGCFAVVGWFTGWLVGASESPVAATLLPLVFGLLGALGFGLLEARAYANRLVEVLSKPGTALSSPASEQATNRAPVDDRTLIVWCVGLAIYCGLCYVGIEQGIGRRVPRYPPLEQLLGTEGRLTSASELAQVHRLRLGLIRQNVAVADAQSIFEGPVRVFFQDPAYKPGGALGDVRQTSLESLVTTLLSAGTVPAGRGRGPASEDTAR